MNDERYHDESWREQESRIRWEPGLPMTDEQVWWAGFIAEPMLTWVNEGKMSARQLCDLLTKAETGDHGAVDALSEYYDWLEYWRRFWIGITPEKTGYKSIDEATRVFRWHLQEDAQGKRAGVAGTAALEPGGFWSNVATVALGDYGEDETMRAIEALRSRFKVRGLFPMVKMAGGKGADTMIEPIRTGFKEQEYVTGSAHEVAGEIVTLPTRGREAAIVEPALVEQVSNLVPMQHPTPFDAYTALRRTMRKAIGHDALSGRSPDEFAVGSRMPLEIAERKRRMVADGRIYDSLGIVTGETAITRLVTVTDDEEANDEAAMTWIETCPSQETGFDTVDDRDVVARLLKARVLRPYELMVLLAETPEQKESIAARLGLTAVNFRKIRQRAREKCALWLRSDPAMS